MHYYGAPKHLCRKKVCGETTHWRIKALELFVVKSLWRKSDISGKKKSPDFSGDFFLSVRRSL
jgi:hypothetical protein